MQDGFLFEAGREHGSCARHSSQLKGTVAFSNDRPLVRRLRFYCRIGGRAGLETLGDAMTSSLHRRPLSPIKGDQRSISPSVIESVYMSGCLLGTTKNETTRTVFQ
jgi:hypothetical protein